MVACFCPFCSSSSGTFESGDSFLPFPAAGSTLRAVVAMREAGFTVQHAVCILDRGEGGRDALKQNGIELAAIFTAEEFKE